jgi:hypothetical protein
MGSAVEPLRARLIAAVLHRPDLDIDAVLRRLRRRFGAPELSYGPVPFTYTNYYNREMGSGLLKRYLAFGRTIAPDAVAGVKVFTNRLEREFARNGKRTVNIDPGYLTNDKLVLASTKNFFHRIYLGKGIHAEVTLHFRKGRYRYFSWTYPDFREPAVQEFLMKVRAKFVKRLRDRASRDA